MAALFPGCRSVDDSESRACGATGRVITCTAFQPENGQTEHHPIKLLCRKAQLLRDCGLADTILSEDGKRFGQDLRGFPFHGSWFVSPITPLRNLNVKRA